MTTQPTKYWAIWRETGGAPPSKKHTTKAEAMVEAGRLASSSQERYYILEAVGYVEPVQSPIVYKDTFATAEKTDCCEKVKATYDWA